MLCKVCNDHGRKGKRAAFNFDSDGSCSYHCFNCGISSGYSPTKHRYIPRRMVEILTAFSVPKDEWDALVFSNFGKQLISTPRETKTRLLDPAIIEMPEFFKKLTEDADDDISYVAKEHLKSRGISFKEYDFYTGQLTTAAASRRWACRLIIPIYKDGNIVYYQGRDLTDLAQRKYLSPDLDRSRVIYGYEHLFTNIDEPLYITEGWFDAFHLNGVAVFGSKMYDEQIAWLNSSPRKKVVIPDQFGGGRSLADVAINNGWSVSTPDAPDCNDVSDIIEKYGHIYCYRTIVENTHEGFAARVNANIYCKD